LLRAGEAHMAAGKIIPIIDSAVEAGDQALRDDLYAALVAIDARIVVLEHKIDRKIEELIAWRNETRRGQPHS
jgi:hypothetical protein